jgi:hypothetical protein
MKLFGFERRWLLAVFETILPSGTDPRLSLGAADLPMLRFLDDAEARSPFEYLLGVRVALWVAMASPWLLLYSWRPWSWLDATGRLEALRRLQHHRIYALRELPSLLKTVACLGYCGVPSVQAAIGVQRVDATEPSWMIGGER